MRKNVILKNGISSMLILWLWNSRKRSVLKATHLKNFWNSFSEITLMRLNMVSLNQPCLCLFQTARSPTLWNYRLLSTVESQILHKICSSLSERRLQKYPDRRVCITCSKFAATLVANPRLSKPESSSSSLAENNLQEQLVLKRRILC